jgi:heptosyltransferase-1
MTINELVAVVSAAKLVVAGDTGPLHVAAALGTPAVGIYGPTDPGQNGPWGQTGNVVSRHEVCVCHYRRRCRAKRRCIDSIEVDEVCGKIETLFASKHLHGFSAAVHST